MVSRIRPPRERYLYPCIEPSCKRTTTKRGHRCKPCANKRASSDIRQRTIPGVGLQLRPQPAPPPPAPKDLPPCTCAVGPQEARGTAHEGKCARHVHHWLIATDPDETHVYRDSVCKSCGAVRDHDPFSNEPLANHRYVGAKK